jgi:hypothetical protein
LKVKIIWQDGRSEVRELLYKTFKHWEQAAGGEYIKSIEELD